MRMRLWIGLLACVLAALPARAQETRGNINGVVQDQSGVVPGATVRITNTNTGQTQQLVTNGSGYFEALLLNPGTYAARVELAGFKALTQTGITLAVGQTLSLSLKLEVGQISELITVTAEAPLIDTTTVSSGQNFDRRLVEALPMFSNMPIMLSRFTPGVAPAEAEVQNIFQGYMEGTTSAAGGQVGTGSGFDSRNTGNLYTIDGAMNNGFGRRIASSPNSDQIEEVRIETSNFDASQGHGTGLTVSMMTRSGTNSLRGSGNYTHWNNKLNSPNLQQKVTFALEPRQEDAFREGRSHIAAFTLGGPVVIPKVLNGRDKVFFFANYSKSNDSAPGRLAGTSTVPANRKHLEGDFSDLLLLPSGANASTPPGHHQFQIYDPLTTRPDPLRPGRVIRTPFPGNIIPKDRFMNPDGTYKNPAFGLYQAMVPAPNQNFISSTQQPVNNYFRAAEPDQPHNTQGSLRIDYNHSESDRFFLRVNGNRFLESSLVDWTYDSPDPQFRGLHDVARARYSWSATGTWTKVLTSSTLIDTQISGNRAYQRDTRKNLIDYRPTSIGLPGYMDEFCQARLECILPQNNISSYQAMGGTVDRGIWVTTYQGQSNLTSTRGSHTWRGGVDVQWAQRTAKDGAGNMGTFNYDNTYTRAADTTNVFVVNQNQVGLSLAAFMLGLPTSVSVAEESGFDVRNNYFGTFVQDTWRVGRNLTLNLGLRFEYENGIKEVRDRSLLWFDPEAEVSIASIAAARYAASPIPGLPASEFNVQGGTVYAGAEGYDDRSWKGEALWMPRFSFGYRLGEKMAVKGGYGMYYDTLNARDWTPDLQGFNVTTSNPLSNDFGRTFLLGNPQAGVLPLVDPFPVRAATGSRYESLLGNALGFDTMLGRGFTADNPNRKHARVQRWRLSWQREIASRTALEVSYAGSYADRQGITIRQDFLPEQYWSSANVRDTSANDFLTANVPNPFFINNFASLQTTDPLLFQRLQGSAVYTSPTIQRHRLLRAFPHMGGVNQFGQMVPLNYADQPLGVIKAHTFEAVLTQRYAKGLTGHFAFSTNRVTENRTVEEYDREPTLWQTNNNGRPWRITGVGLYELPFGPGRAFLDEGGVLAAIASGWSLSGTYEYQPGALLNWGNIFFNGNLADIKKDNPEIALQPDGTFDPTKTWFNIDAGFVRATADQPAGFQKRVFPFRVDGVRGQSLSMTNMGIARTFDLPGTRTFQFRVDVQNLFNRQHYQNPNLDPTSTNFGQVRAVNNTVMRFITFNTTLRF
jgi:hypothetical protein